jgi:DNA invertase Pin-like site-specific DNA recombinase
MLVGYMRVSSDSDRQNTDLQRDALLAAGVDPRHLFEDYASGAKDDTTTPSGEFLFQVFGALAQYERALIQERVVAGLAAARKRGRIGGRPQSITGEKLDAIIAALDGRMSKAAVCRNFNVKRTTLIETLARIGWPAPSEAGE